MTFIEKINFPDIKHIIVVAGATHRVGCSTVAAGLAVTLAAMGFKTAIADANVYNPVVPQIFGVEGQQPQIIEFKGIQFMLPVESLGVKIISVGFFLNTEQQVSWDRSLATGTIEQLMRFTHWEETDFLILDMPPGKGDIPVFVLERYPISAILAIYTPGKKGFADAQDILNFYGAKKENILFRGVVGNITSPNTTSGKAGQIVLHNNYNSHHESILSGTYFMADIPYIALNNKDDRHIRNFLPAENSFPSVLKHLADKLKISLKSNHT